MEKNYDHYLILEEEYKKIKKRTLPLCAAENIISEFSKIPLNKDFQERYVMNGINSYNAEDNFIGSKFLHEIYQLVNQQCSKIFGSQYADARTLTGMNCVTTLLMSITENNDKIMLQTSQSGGHPSMKWVCERLGLKIIDMPYDYQNRNIDYDKVYEILKKENIKFILYAPSDIINTPDYSKLTLPDNTVFLYDASQTLGLICGKQVDNPLEKFQEKNCIVFGGTHKTLPGPANGLILTNSAHWAQKIDETISPLYLRHSQMHQVASLLFTLYEMEEHGEAYTKKIIEMANVIGNQLKENGIRVIGGEGTITSTHQLFIQTSETDMKVIFNLANKYNITLNKKDKKLFDNYGIRLGTQEIARMAWENEEEALKQIVDILLALFAMDESKLKKLMNGFTLPVDIRFTFKTVVNS
ncbi:serine hydroxymethyltransferase [Erysipelotrichaceae bacterium]|nr:serine hydroxymethyltransferase [Erysipelotrichaceae bacterium]